MTDSPAPDRYGDFSPALQIHLHDFEAGVDTLMDELEAGDIEPYAWRDRFAEMLTVYAATGYAAGAREEGRKEPPKRGSKAWIWLAVWIALQLDYLNGFAEAVRKGRESGVEIPGAWRNRARMYVTSIVAPYWYGKTENLPLPALPGDGTSQCGQNDACGWEIVWLDKENGDIDAYWRLNQRRVVKVHCQTCEVRAEKWNPLRIRKWEIITPPIEKETLKHFPGQHDQSRHAWRYNADPSRERGPRQDDTAGIDAFERRASTRRQYTAEQIKAAKDVVRAAAVRYNAEMAEYHRDQAAFSETVAKYEVAKGMLNEKSRAYNKIAGPLHQRIAEKMDAAEQASENYRRTGDERWLKKRETLDKHIAQLRARLNSHEIVSLSMQTAELEIEKRKRESDVVNASMLLSAKHGANVLAANRRYIESTGDARRVLYNHYNAQGEALRKKAVAKADRMVRASDKNRARGDAARKEADALQRELAAQGDPDPYHNPRVQALYRRSRDYWARAGRQRDSANAMFGDGLKQADPARLKGKDFDSVSAAGRAIRDEAVGDFGALVGRNPFLESYQVGFVTDREPFSRASFMQFNLGLADLGKRNRGARILESEKRSHKAGVVHELGHALEAADPGARVEALNFFLRRTEHSSPTPLYGEMKIGHLDLSEYGYRDKFIEPYMGKTYRKDKGRPGLEEVLKINGSWGEILSVGLQYFYENPVKLARQDPEFFRFLYAVLRINA
jgi:hypothetical protein